MQSVQCISLTVSKFPLRNSFDFFCTNQKFEPSSSVCVIDALANVTLRIFLKLSRKNILFLARF